MDMSTIKKRIQNDKYRNVDDMSHDVHLMFDNCVKYNSEASAYGKVSGSAGVCVCVCVCVCVWVLVWV